MRIAQIVCVFEPYRSGIGNIAKQYAEIVHQAGYESFVITPRYKNRKQYSSNSFEMVYLRPLLEYGNGSFIPQLVSKLRDFDIVHLHYPFYGGSEAVWLAKIIKKIKIKLIIHYHMDVIGLDFAARFLRLPDKIIRRSLFNIADQITCASLDYIKDSNIKRIYAKQANKIREIPFAVDTNKFKPLVKNENGIFKLLFVGGLDKAHIFKGVKILLPALKKIKNLNWQLNIIGDGDLKDNYQQIAAACGLTNKINFVGQASDNELIGFYQDSGLLLFPSISRNEAFGIVIIEALACGLPVVASRLPGVRKVFCEGQEGLYFEPGNSGQLAQKIEYMLSHPEIQSAMGRQARALAMEKYSQEIMKRKIISLYEDLFNK